MALHLLHAGRLARKLAADAVTPGEQAAYFAATIVAWLCATYLLNLPPAFASTPSFFTRGLWFGEFALLVLINWSGAYFCLRQCMHEPRRHFLVDLTCLSAPATIVALVLTWTAFYAGLWGFHFAQLALAEEPLFSPDRYLKLQDLLVYFVVVGQVALTYFIAGRYMRRAAVARMEAR